MRLLDRKWTMVLLAVPFMAGLTLIITASGEWMLDLGRFLFGTMCHVPFTMCQVSSTGSSLASRAAPLLSLPRH